MKVQVPFLEIWFLVLVYEWSIFLVTYELVGNRLVQEALGLNEYGTFPWYVFILIMVIYIC